jgi:DNA-binding LacI/PurR family transcriptional regulator/signal transduction histidine kinase
MQRESGGRKRPLTLALLVDWLEDDYQNEVVSGVADAARKLGVNLICFAGGVLRSPHRYAAQRNAVYELAGPENVDAVLLMSGTLGNHVGPEELSRFCRRFRPLPMCSVAVPLPGIPSVLVDNATGMRELIVHLVEGHGCRRVAFIRGPEASWEAERRYRVYCDVLAEHGLAVDPALVVVGDFQRTAGAAAISVLLDERRAAVDAVVAASDSMALGAIDALRARGVRVPEDVAVVGFDDIEGARFATPALTTVRQPLHEQGARAVELLLAELRGEAVPAQVTLHTELVRRHSCRCAWRWTRHDPPVDPPSGPTSFAGALAARRSVVVAEMARALSTRIAGLDEAWADRILSSFVTDLHDHPGGSRVVTTFDEILRQVITAGADLGGWHDVLSVMRRELLPCLAADPDLRARADDLWHDLRLLVAGVAQSREVQHRLEAARRARDLSGASEALVTAFDLPSLARAAVEQLPRLSIGGFYLSLYERGEGPAGQAGGHPHTPGQAGGHPHTLGRSRLVIAYDAARATSFQPDDPVFPSQRLAPYGALPDRRATMVLEPLFFKEEQLGFALFEMGPREGAIYESLREQISAALKGALLVQEVVEKDREQAILLADLERRARELTEANRAISENQEKLLISEKLASLGRLTASIVHEMNTPLAAVRAALVDLGKLVTEYQQSVADPAVTGDDHGEIVAEMRQAIGLAGSAAERAALFVRGIKSQTRDLGPHERRLFDVTQCIREALLLLSYALRKGRCRVVFEPPAEPVELLGSPVRFSQVVTNLVENAVDASAPAGGHITLALSPGRGAVTLTVRDQGTGITREVLPRIFEPMFTTKPFGQGTGLGLAIVHDIVTGDFGGTIHVDSEVGRGSLFMVSFPHSLHDGGSPGGDGGNPHTPASANSAGSAPSP